MALVVTDAFEGTTGEEQELTETLTLSDTFTTAWVLSKTYSETLTLTDSFFSSTNKVISETLTLTERVFSPTMVGSWGLMSFDGVNETLEIADNDKYSVPTTGEFSVSMWINPATLDFDETISSGDGPYVHFFGKTDYDPVQTEWVFRLYNLSTGSRPNRTSFYVFNEGGGTGVGSYFQGGISDCPMMVANEWIHVVATVSPTHVSLYRNSTLFDTDNYLGTITPTNTTAHVMAGGLRNGSDYGYFEGQMDKIKIFNYTLNQSQIDALYSERQEIILSETLTLSDGDTYTPAKVLSETITLTDTYSTAWILSKTYSETLTLTDDFTGTSGVAATLSETLSLTDTYSRVWLATPEFSEVLKLGMTIPVAHWKMNDNLSTANVLDSVGSNNGSLNENTTNISTTGKINSSLKFDGATNFINVGDQADLDVTGNFSIAGWFKIIDDVGIQMLIGKYDGASYANNDGGQGYELMYRGDFGSKRLQFRINNGVSTGTTTKSDGAGYSDIGDNIWHHIVAVADRANGQGLIYVDGANVVLNDFDDISPQNGDLSNTGDFILGRQSGEGTRNFVEGDMDDVRFYNQALTLEEVNSIYSSGNGTEAEDPIPSLAFSLQKTFSETLALADGDNYSATVVLSETISLTDTYSRAWVLTKEYSETVTMADTISSSFDRTLTLTDTITLADTYSSVWSLAKEMTETITLSDTFESAFTSLKELTETLTLSDYISRTYPKVLTETLTLFDGDTYVWIIEKELTETMSLSDVGAILKDGGDILVSLNIVKPVLVSTISGDYSI